MQSSRDHNLRRVMRRAWARSAWLGLLGLCALGWSGVGHGAGAEVPGVGGDTAADAPAGVGSVDGPVLESSDRAPMPASPAEAGPTGHLRIHVAVPAEVSLDEVVMGTATPEQALSLRNLPVQPYRLGVSANGHRPLETEIRITEAEWDQQMVRLWPLAETDPSAWSFGPMLATTTGTAPTTEHDLTANDIGEVFTIVTGNCRMEHCWWWGISRVEPIGARDEAHLLHTRVSTTWVNYPPVKSGWDDEVSALVERLGAENRLYPQGPPVQTHWEDETDVYVLCSRRLPVVFLPGDEGRGFTGSIPFDRDGFTWGATEGIGQLWRHLCGHDEAGTSRFDGLPDPPPREIRIDDPLEALDLL
ncbi:MAG: hypothetical protein EOM22_00275 [Gammaproteobacteria bacterium]|nr:hypothetical protein [Gammaproteobacteria bacterium]